MSQPLPGEPLTVSEDRLARMRDGAEALWRWLGDVCRDGLASLEDRPEALDDRVAALHDASLGGMARWLNFVAERVGEQAGWPTVVAGELGRLALLTAGWTRYDQLDDDVRAAILVRSGVSVRKSAVEASAVRVPGLWTVVGERIEEDDRGLVSRRTALIGPRPALVVEHEFGQAPRSVAPAGHELFAEVAFWPGRGSVRARVIDPAVTQEWSGEGATSLEETLDTISTAFGINPLLQRIPVAIRDVRAVRESNRTWLVGPDGKALPVAGNAWDLLTRTGGDTVTVGGVWTGRAVDVMSVVHEGEYHPVHADDAEPPAPRSGLDARTQRLLVGTSMADLLDAGRHSIVCRAAPVLSHIEVTEPLADLRPGMPAGVSTALERALRTHPHWLDIVVDVARSRGERITAPLIQRLLGVPEAQWMMVEPLLGPSERKLAAMEERWRWAAALPLDVGWDRSELRAACLHAALASNPERARAELRARWPDVARASDRVALLNVLARWVQPDDAAWIEHVSDDDAVTVRRAASAALANMNGQAGTSTEPDRVAAALRAVEQGDARPLAAVRAPWPETLVHAWRAGLERHITSRRAADQGPEAAWVDSLAHASRWAPLDQAPIVNAPLPDLRTTDPLWRQLIVASREAADRLRLRVRFQAGDLGPNGASSEPVG